MNENMSVTRSNVFTASCCVLSFGGGAGAVPEPSAPAPLPAIVVESGSTQGTAGEVSGFPFRGTIPTLMANPAIRVTAFCLEKHLVDFLGAGHGIRFVFEELVSPDDPDQEPLLFAIALLPDEAADELLDTFIMEKWSTQPVDVRKVMRIGREF